MNPRLIEALRWIPALLWMGMIFMMSHQPGGDSGAFSKMVLEWFSSIGLDLRAVFGNDAFWIIRKMAHFTEYLILCLFLLFALRPRLEWPKLAWITLICVFAYACSDEYHQLFVPRRIGDFFDVMIDTSGGVTALLIVWMVRAIRQRKARHSLASQSK